MVVRAQHNRYGIFNVAIDYISRALIVKPVEHQMTHEGLHYVALALFQAVDIGDICTLRIKTPPDLYMHTVFDLSSSSIGTFKVVKNSTLTHVEANEIDIINRNDASTNVSFVPEICIDPGGTETSTELLVPLQTAGAAGKFTEAPGASRDSQEYILNIDTVYSFVFISGADDNAVNLGIDYYETDNTL